MHIRPVPQEDLGRFIEAAGFHEHRNEVDHYLRRMFAAGSMRPEWCFIAEEEDRPIGRIAFWTLPGIAAPFALVLLDVDWEDDYAAVGTRLLRHAVEAAQALGAEDLEHVIDAPPMRPQFQHYAQKRIELLKNAGFYLRRETGRYEWSGVEPATEPGRLALLPLEEVGDEKFIEAMERVSEDGLDQEIRAEREKLGTKQAAQEFFDDASRVQHDASWWQLAYAPNGELAGLIMPAEPPGFLTIFYVGVVPDMRGRGYVNDLLASGTSTLLQARKDDEPLIADTDVSNAPMAAFRAGGMDQVRREARVRRGSRPGSRISRVDPGCRNIHAVSALRRRAVREPPLQVVGSRIPARDRGFPVRGGPGSARMNRSRKPVPSQARRRARNRKDIWDRAVV